jgi:hypothetical protein
MQDVQIGGLFEKQLKEKKKKAEGMVWLKW